MRSMLQLSCVLAIGFAGGNYVAHNVEWPSVTQGSQARPSSDADPAAEASTQTDSQYPAFEEWTQDSAPNYYQVLGAAQVEEAPQPGEVRYGEPDGLGRATGVVAGVTFDLMEEGLSRQRGDLSSVYPTGWGHNREVDMAMPDGTIYHGGDTYTLTRDDDVLYAWWAPQFTLTYDANGGDGQMPRRVFSASEEAVISDNAFTRKGYDFVGWCFSADGRGKIYQSGDTITLTEDATLYA